MRRVNEVNRSKFMNENKLSFDSENLVVDYISFNISGLVDPEPIANYFSESLSFNSVLKETFKGKSEDLIFEIRNRYKVSFIKSSYNPDSNSYWTGMTVKFSGKNGQYFYSLVQKKLIDWCIFDLSCTNLGRFDLYYFRKFNPIDQDDFPESFMENSCEKVNSKSKRKKASWKRTPRGLIMRIGNRSNSNYYRVYQKTKKINYDVYSEMNKGLKFELELKNQLVKSFQKLLFTNNIEEFEGKLVEHFYKHSKKCFVLYTYYTDWSKKNSFKSKIRNQLEFFSKQLFKKGYFRFFRSKRAVF